MSNTRREECPICQGNMIEIVYGYPSPETSSAARRGEIVLGGCILRPSNPTHECGGCGARAQLLGFIPSRQLN